MRSNQCSFWHAQTNGIHGAMADDECLPRAPKIGRKPCPRCAIGITVVKR